MRALRWLALVPSCLCACSSPVGNGGLRVELTTAPGTTSVCARVVVRSTSEVQRTEPLKLGKARPIVVGVAQGSSPARVTVQALGYSDVGCTKATEPAEQSEAVSTTYADPVPVVQLVLDVVVRDGGSGGTDGGADAGVDADNDGAFLPEDCNDNDPAIKPGAAELCSGGVDDDCDQLVDCKDLGCSGLGCGTNGVCIGGDCIAPTETNLCFDGIDNDADGKVDCDDGDCPMGVLCTDHDGCTTGDTCSGTDAGCVASGARICNAPPNPRCFAPSGVCLGDGGLCSYTQSTGACDDGLACTVGEQCVADGGACVGTPVVCAAPPTVCFAAGACSEALDGGCLYLPLTASATCDDGDTCTRMDACAGDGGCAGIAVSCTPPGQCFGAKGCDADGGCLFAVLTNQACDAGFCGADGGCQPPIFGYPTTNFTQPQLPVTAGALAFGCGATVLNTGLADGGIQWTNNCATNAAAPEFALVPVGTQTALLLFADALFIDAGSSLRAVGPRPLILAVRGNATIAGTLDVGSTKTSRGAGGSVGCVAGAGGDGGVQDGGAGGQVLSGGGGGGAAFGTDGTNGSGSETSAPGGVRGLAFGNATLDPLRGGCRGGPGGLANATWGFGGHGGGAVQLSAAGAVVVTATGTISAAGAGGKGGESDQHIGGGGAGSGGGILVEGTTITVAVNGAITANGGGGAEGSGFGGAAFSGDDGDDGQPRSTAAAQGGASAACGGNGGNGACRLSAAGAAGPPGCNQSIPGGGGGGGVGRIRLNAATSCSLAGGNIISPQATGNRAGCF